MFNPFPNRGPQPPQGPMNPMNMIQDFRKFVRDFQGDPEQFTKQLLSSGQMTQDQFNQINNLWNQFGQFFK